jgi:4-hydroxybenzoate adenylyltransferase
VDMKGRNSNLFEQLVRGTGERAAADRLALITGDGGYTFAEVYQGARTASAVLAAHGIRAGDPLLLVLPDGIDLVRIFLGALRLGAIPVTGNYEQHAAELGRAAQIIGPRAVISTDGRPAGWPGRVIAAGEFRCGDGQLPVPPAAWCDADTPAYGLLTSGTTGEPRLCVHTHADPPVYHASFSRAVLGLSPPDISYSVSRMYFSYGLCNSVFYPQLSGSTAVLTASRPEPAEALATIERHRVSVFYAQPSFYARLLAAGGAEVLARLRLAVVAGEPLPTPLEADLRRVLGGRLINILGATEVGNAFACALPGRARPGWIGPALPPYQVRVVDVSGAPVPPHAEGQLEVRGPTVSPGVARLGEQRRHGGGFWWRTGDTALTDEQGIVKVLGRADDIEVIGGVNVHPAETEEVLVRHPLILEAAVCAVRDGVQPTRLRAVVVLASQAADRAAVPGELLAVARQELTWYKVPCEVVFTDKLPRTPTGKLDRRRLRRAFGHGTAA